MAAIPSIPRDLPTLVEKTFQKAKASEALYYWPTQCHQIDINGLPFQLRFSEAIAKRPKVDNQKDKKKNFDPFDNPKTDLLITELEPSHILVLNKFAIIPHHFILATKEFKWQYHMLEEADVATAYACIEAWRSTGKDLFAFFNSGDYSGASQPHRHIQFLPVDGMTADMKDKDWHPIVDDLAANPSMKLPFAHFAAELSDNPSSADLYEMYLKLHDQACKATLEHIKQVPRDSFMFKGAEDGSSPISYNLAMTHKTMALCPRRAEGKMIERENHEQSFGPITFNGTVLGGTLLVQHYNEWDGLRDKPEDLASVLEVIGIPTAA